MWVECWESHLVEKTVVSRAEQMVDPLEDSSVLRMVVAMVD